jgi:signal transduction histidine kinase
MHEAMQREFINIAAHELRTPIQPLLGVADIMLARAKDSDKVQVSRSELEMILRNAKRLERLAFELLEVSRIETGSLKLQTEAVNLNQEIVDVVADGKNILPVDRHLEIALELPQEHVILEADRARLFEVVSNLIHNAIKFTDRGKIVVKLEKKNDFAVISIKDSGMGINADVEPRLFTKFTSKSDKGTGLGLFISKHIVEAHGGKIWAKNNDDGPGATFSFSLPMLKSSEH